MGSLSNLYISQSFKSLIHLGNDNSASATQVELQDGVGAGLGIYVNNAGDVTIDGALIVSGTFDIEGKIVVNDDVRINGNLEVSGSTKFTGSLVVSNQLTASSAFIQNDLNVGGTLFASKVVTLIESSSIIFSSGSNILGDDISDTQTLIGSVIVSGSGALTGSMGISGDLEVKGNISSSTVSGIGNVTLYSQSVDARLDIVEATASLFVPFSQSVDARLDVVEATASLYIPFSTSVDSRLDFLEGPFSTSVDARLDVVEATASLYVPFSTSVDSRLDFLEGPFSTSVDARLDIVEATASLYVPFSTSVDARLDALEAFTGSQGLVSTASFNAYTASVNSALSSIYQTTASLNTFTQSTNSRLNSLEAATSSYANSASVAADFVTTNNNITSLSQSVSSSNALTNNRINVLSSFTGSYATTGSNSFNGNQTITGSLILSSSAAIELEVIGNSVFTGSVRGRVSNLSISSNTASMDLSLGNFFTITLNTSQACRIEPTNIQPGQTTTLRVTQASGGGGTVQFPTNVDFPTGFQYSATPAANATDILTFLSFDTASLYYSRANQFI
jgi:DNA-dependent RNA polymerase auxiliary subunit epsilon